MFKLIRAVSWQPIPKGENVAIVTNAGGPAIITTDRIVMRGMKVANFSLSATAKYLHVSFAHYYDYTGAIKYHLPIPMLDITASVGYRYQDIVGKDGGDETKIQFQGAFAEIGAKF